MWGVFDSVFFLFSGLDVLGNEGAPVVPFSASASPNPYSFIFTMLSFSKKEIPYLITVSYPSSCNSLALLPFPVLISPSSPTPQTSWDKKFLPYDPTFLNRIPYLRIRFSKQFPAIPHRKLLHHNIFQ